MEKIGRTIKRRRKQNKTDYKARLQILKGSKPRLVVRKTNRFVIVQVVETDVAQDKVIASANSKELLNMGWPKESSGSLKNKMACYLTGLILAKKIKSKELILDIGLQRNVHKGRLYSVLKGAIDGGVKIKYNEKALPEEDNMKSEKTSKIYDKVKGEILKHG